MKWAFFPIITCLLLALTVKGYPQADVLDQKVTLSFEGISLAKLLDHLNAAYKLSFSYSADNVPVHKAISIKAFDLPLRSFIERLCDKAELAYRVIGDHIVLREELFKEASPLSQAKGNFDLMDAHGTGPEPWASSRNLMPAKTIQPVNPFDSIALEPSMGSLDEAQIVALPLKGPGSKGDYKERSPFAIGLAISHDRLRFDFKERPNTDQKYCAGENFSAGASAIFWLGEKVSASIGLLFSTKSYYLDYNYKVNNPEDPFPFPERTTAHLSYAEFPVNINFRFFRAGRFSLYLSTGLTAEFLIHEGEKTRFLNTKDKATAYFEEDNNRFLWGASMGVKLRYRLGKSVSIIFKPGYVYYFAPLNAAAMDSNLQLFKLKAGMSLKINAFKQL